MIGAITIRPGKSDSIIIIAALLVSAAINVMIIQQIMSRDYVSLGLFIAAAGVAVAQIPRRRRKAPAHQSKTDLPPATPPSKPSGEPHPGGKLLTAVWFVVILAWAASLVYVIFFM